MERALGLYSLLLLGACFLNPLFLIGVPLPLLVYRYPRCAPLLPLPPLLLAWWTPWGLFSLLPLLLLIPKKKTETQVDRVRVWMRERPGCRIRARWAGGHLAHLAKDWQVTGRLELLGVDSYKTRGVERDNECIFWILLHQERGLMTGNVAQVFRSPKGTLEQTNKYLKGTPPPGPESRVPQCLLNCSKYRHPIMV